MDINSIEAEIAQDENIVDIPIYQKNGEQYTAKDGTPSTIGIVGSDSKSVKAARNTVQRRMLRLGRKAEPADLLKNRLIIAKAAGRRWTGWELGDTPAPYSEDNLAKLLTAEHILAQVEAGIDGHADFFSAASTT